MERNERRAFGTRHHTPPQSFTESLSTAATQNPIATALVGMGLLWMLGGGGSTTLAGMFSPAQSSGQRRRAPLPSRGVAGSVGDMAGKLASTVSGAVSATYEKASDAVEVVGRTFSSSDSEVDQGRRDGANSDSQHAVRYGGPTPYGALQGLTDFLEQRPLALGAAGLALGAGIAASLPVTDTERNMLGKASRRVTDKLSQSAGQVKEAASAAFDEARSQGLVPDALDEVVRKS